MNASSLYRRTPGLLAGITLLLSCFLFSGCVSYVVRTQTLFGEYRDQFPAIVLSVDAHEYTFDWNEATIGGVSASKFIPDKKFWRLNVFQFSDGKRIGENDYDFQPIAKTQVTFVKLPWDKLLRADLEFTDDPKSATGRTVYSFIVLLHNEPDACCTRPDTLTSWDAETAPK